jgi:predicted small lipoprotein YifL
MKQRSAFICPRVRTLAGAIVAVASLAGCGSSKPAIVPTVETVAPNSVAAKILSVQEATVLSRVLFQNFDKGGAKVSADVPYGLESSIKINGVVDWKTHTGRAEVTVVGFDGKLFSTSTVFWRDLYNPQAALVATTLDGLTEAMAAQGQVGVKYVARPASEQSPRRAGNAAGRESAALASGRKSQIPWCRSCPVQRRRSPGRSLDVWQIALLGRSEVRTAVAGPSSFGWAR